MINIDVQVNEAQLNDIEKKLGHLKNKAPTVLQRAINRAVQKAKTEAKDGANEEYFITKGNIEKTLRATRASRTRLSAELTSRGGPIALTKFKVSPKRAVTRTKRGKPSPKSYKAAVKRDSGLTPLSGDPKAFFTIMGTGHEGVMERVSNRRLPLKQLYGPAVPSMIKNEEVIERIQKESTETLEKRIDAEINNILQRG